MGKQEQFLRVLLHAAKRLGYHPRTSQVGAGASVTVLDVQCRAAHTVILAQLAEHPERVPVLATEAQRQRDVEAWLGIYDLMRCACAPKVYETRPASPSGFGIWCNGDRVLAEGTFQSLTHAKSRADKLTREASAS